MITRRRITGGLAAGSLVGMAGRAAGAAQAGPAPGIAVKNARDVRNGWGVNVPNDANSADETAAALDFLGTRWARLQFDGDTSPAVAALQRSLARRGGPEPDLKLQLLLNGYLQGADRNTWSAQQRWITRGVLPVRRSDGRPVLAAIEGPNELNSGNGGGSRGPDDAVDRTGGQVSTADNPAANANFVTWARELAAFRHANARALRGVEILSPTVLYYFPRDWSRALDVSRYVDFGTFHYYAGIGGTGGVPSWPPNPDNFSRMYRFAQAGISPGRPLVQSEGGFTSHADGGYAADGRSGARYQLMQLFDHHAMGGHRYIVYDLFNNAGSNQGHVTADGEDNYGQFFGDRRTPKASAIALHNVSHLLSLGNDGRDPRNRSDTADVRPAFDAAALRVTGLRDAGTAGHALVMPKSDGSTMLAVWNEPAIDQGSGRSLTPAANPVVVDLGTVQGYGVYDPTGGGGAADFEARSSTTPIATGRGRFVELTLVGTPLLVELKRP